MKEKGALIEFNDMKKRKKYSYPQILIRENNGKFDIILASFTEDDLFIDVDDLFGNNGGGTNE